MDSPLHESTAKELNRRTSIPATYGRENSYTSSNSRNNSFSDYTTDKRAQLNGSTATEPGRFSPKPTPIACSTPTLQVSDSSATSENLSLDAVTDQDILEEQTLKPGEEQSDYDSNIRTKLSVSRTDLSSREVPTNSVTGLPGSDKFQKDKLAATANPGAIALDDLTTRPSSSRKGSNSDKASSSRKGSNSDKASSSEMGNNESKNTDQMHPRHIITEEPQFLENRTKVLESEVTGNCRPWSDHVYYKLFMDTEGRNATLMVLKCEITYVDVFTDQEHSLYKSRFIGGKADGVAQMFVFDLMKSSWEDKIPKSQAIELNVDIVMSSSPIHHCTETLLQLIQLEKTFLKHRNFDGQLNIMIRFAHAYGWDIRDDSIRERVHMGLRNLYREGVNLEVMSADTILEEMRVDGILLTSDEKIKHYIAKRHSWRGLPMKSSQSSQKSQEGTQLSDHHAVDYNYGDVRDNVATTSSRPSNSLAQMTDSYYVLLHGGLWNIIQDTKRIQSILDETVDED